MKRCPTRHKLFYCWHNEGVPAIKETKPDDFDTLPMADTVCAPNLAVAVQVYVANTRITRGRK